jgi:phenylacetate-CoA ligase
MRSHLPGITWPAVPDAPTATLLALQWQLEQTQWWSAERLAAEQQRQLAPLLAHARDTTLHHAELPAAWADIAVQTRHDLIAAGARLLSRRYPASHGAAPETFSSRTTGEPVRVRVPDIVTTFWNAITLRDHLWHRRDLGAHLAAIRHTGAGVATAPGGLRGAGWGPATAALAPDAPLSLLSIDATTEEQVAWLRREDPVYLLVYPTVLGAIARHLAATGQRLPSLRQVRTISEALSPDTRALCAEVLGVPLVDTYSAQEVGYIALQCPDHPRYHVQAERLLVEILDDDGGVCRPGEIGRVVVTDLHNFATPLIRYDLGDLAEVGAPCPCGRGLPVLERIIGRRRGMLVHADGRTTWPVFTVACRAAAPYRELQLVQETLDRLRLRVVPLAGTPITPAQRDALAAAIRGALGAFTVEVELVERLDRSPAGKLEEFVSHVATAWRAPPPG